MRQEYLQHAQIRHYWGDTPDPWKKQIPKAQQQNIQNQQRSTKQDGNTNSNTSTKTSKPSQTLQTSKSSKTSQVPGRIYQKKLKLP